ncbi:MAG: D-alanine--D-alanine ligase family protein [Planctomycetota bacterium]|jgi:D-alanine-D-alanine ligase
MTIEPATNIESPPAGGQLKVAVLTGGIGEEREISIQSGSCVSQALKEAGLNVVTADISPDNLAVLQDSDIDVFFVALHGRFGEDGQLQQILEDRSLVYTGSGPQASTVAFDKLASKDLFAGAGLTVPKVLEFDLLADAKDIEDRLARLSDKFVVKPIRQGSTIGVCIVDDPRSAVEAARRCSEQFGDCMIEQYIRGREITVGILGSQALPIIEIKTQTGFYDYQAKYLDDRTEFLFDTIDRPELTARIKDAALDCFEALGCRHFARVDFVLGEDQKPYVLELNTIPGFTTHSLLPLAAAKAGLSMSRLCLKIVEAALADKGGSASQINPAMMSGS